jgi:hypothetical protein
MAVVPAAVVRGQQRTTVTVSADGATAPTSVLVTVEAGDDFPAGPGSVDMPDAGTPDAPAAPTPSPDAGTTPPASASDGGCALGGRAGTVTLPAILIIALAGLGLRRRRPGRAP